MEITDYHFEAITAYLFKVFIAMGILSYTKRICNLSELKVLAKYHWFSKKLNFGDYIYIYAFSQFFIIWHYT
jgi:hypothetical protein